MSDVRRGAIDENKKLWEQWTRINVASDLYEVDAFKEGRERTAGERGAAAGVRLRDYELEEIGDVRGRSVLHLMCHFGIDTLSFARLGAEVTGIDFSPAAIEQARKLADELQIDARFIESNLYDLHDNLHGEFDIVYTSRGVLGWLPDLKEWARIAAGYVRPGGIFYITEAHPILMVLDDDNGIENGMFNVRWHYWDRPEEPLVFEPTGSYADPTAGLEAGTKEYGWNHSMSEIVSSIAAAGLHIDFLHEYPFLDWPVPWLREHGDGTWRLPSDVPGEIPLSFSLRASKPATPPPPN